MWYSFFIHGQNSNKDTRKASADSILQGAIEIAPTIRETLKPFDYVHSIHSLPSTESILKYFQTELPKFTRRMNLFLIQNPQEAVPSKEIEEFESDLKAAEKFLKNTIKLYSNNPTKKHYNLSFYSELSKVINQLRKIVPTCLGYQSGEEDGSMSDSSYWLSDLLSNGYGPLLNLEKAGLYFTPRYKFAIMSGMDVRSKPSLADDPDRKATFDYISEKYPFYKNMIVSGQDDSKLKNMFLRMAAPDDSLIAEMEPSLTPGEKAKFQKPKNLSVARDMLVQAIVKSGMPTSDLLRYAHIVAGLPVTSNETHRSAVLAMQILYISSVSQALTLLLSSTDNLPQETLNTCVDYWIININREEPLKSISREEIQPIRESPKLMASMTNVLENSNRGNTVICMGLAPIEKTLAYVRANPRAVKNIAYSEEDWQIIEKAVQEGQQANDAIIKEWRDKQMRNNPKSDDSAGLEEDMLSAEPGAARGRSLLQKHIEIGNVLHGTLGDIESGQYMEVAKKIGQSMRLSPEVIERWAKIVQVFVIKNDEFERALSDSKNKGYDTLQDTSFLGAFSSEFSKDEIDKGRLPAIIIREQAIRQQHKEIRVLKVLNIPAEESISAVVGHEIAHALNFVATGGNILRPEHQSGNRGRDYLTSYPEIVARVYGEMPLWKQVLHNQIDGMRESDIIKEAVLSEMTEQLMNDETNIALGGMSPVLEYQRVQRLQHPYDKAENPIAAAEKRIKRAESKVNDVLLAAGREKRREILLDILRKIRICREQVLSLGQLEESTGKSAPEDKKVAQEELNKLEQMKVRALNGSYDMEIDQAVSGVVSNFMLRVLKSMADTISDAEWKPPFTLAGENDEDIVPVIEEGAEPMDYLEVKRLSALDNEWSSGRNFPPKLEDPKMMETAFPTHGLKYEEIFNNDVAPKYEARQIKQKKAASWYAKACANNSVFKD